MVQTPGSTSPHTLRTFSRLITITEKKTSGVEKHERLDAPATQPEGEEMVKVNPQSSVRTQTALERTLAGSWLWCRMASTPPPLPQGGFDLLFSVIRASC